MTIFQTIAVLFTGSAVAAVVNYRLLKLPTSIGLMLFALVVSATGIALSHIGLINFQETSSFVNTIDFSGLFLHGFLSLLLFAGALHIDLDTLRDVRGAVASLATVSVIVSALVTSSLLWLIAQALGLPLSAGAALLFGALIAPTDPIAILSILKTVNISKRFYAKIGGESLFNDGIAITLFITILGIMESGKPLQAADALTILIQQVLGGAMFGALLGGLTYYLLQSISDYKVEVLLTLALATGGYALGEVLGLSAPIAMASAGLFIGHHRRVHGMSKVARTHLDLFWELLDEILNAFLFVLIGLELIIVPLSWEVSLLGLLAIIVVLFGRFVSVGIPIGLIRLFRPVTQGTIRLLTWGGLRGGISIAMALSLPAGTDKDVILSMTYIVVVFSILVQGLTIRQIAAKY